MDKKTIPPYEVESRIAGALFRFEQGDHGEAEQVMLELINDAKLEVDRYFPCLHYGEILMKMGRWEDSREVLIRSAQIALNHKDDRWLVLSHEKLGDLSTVEENLFGALHHYRYALRKAASLSDQLVAEKVNVKADSARSRLHSTVLAQDQNIIPLHKEYVSGNLAISFVHRYIYLKAYFARCLECNFCHDWCCSFGADIDIQNVEKIEQHKEEILPFVRPPEGEWFEAEYSYYEEYAGNRYTRIKPQGPRCAFISKDQRGCGLHRYALSKDMDYHEIKPLVCILFPLSFEEDILLLAPELDDRSLVCAGAGESAYRALRNELEHYFGQELIEELDEIEKRVLSEDLNAATRL
jgi:Fe-S-cluster containining protein